MNKLSHRFASSCLSLLLLLLSACQNEGEGTGNEARKALEKLNISESTYLHHMLESCKAGNLERIKLLLDAGAELPDIHDAVENGHVEVVIFLISKGADVNKANDFKDTPLHLACSRGHLDVVKVLLASGADKNSLNRTGTPLYMAAHFGHEKIVKCLIEAGADVNANSPRTGDTPLHIAAWKGSSRIVTILIEAGADTHKRNKGKHTPAELAYMQGHADVERILRKNMK